MSLDLDHVPAPRTKTQQPVSSRPSRTAKVVARDRLLKSSSQQVIKSHSSSESEGEEEEEEKKKNTRRGGAGSAMKKQTASSPATTTSTSEDEDDNDQHEQPLPIPKRTKTSSPNNSNSPNKSSSSPPNPKSKLPSKKTKKPTTTTTSLTPAMLSKAFEDDATVASKLIINVLRTAAGLGTLPSTMEIDLDDFDTPLNYESTQPVTSKKPSATTFTNIWVPLSLKMTHDELELICDVCVAASRTPIRDMRRIGTEASLRLGYGLLQRVAIARDAVTKSRRLCETEEAECQMLAEDMENSSLPSASTAFAQALDAMLEPLVAPPPPSASQQQQDDDHQSPEDEIDEALQEALSAWRDAGSGILSDKARQLASECVRRAQDVRLCERMALNDIFQKVAARRFRDVDALVRAETAQLLGEMATTHPDAFVVSHRSKYLGWMLFDKSHKVRGEALSALTSLAEQHGKDVKDRFESFLARFSPRVCEMLNDSESSVVISALQLAEAWWHVGYSDIVDETLKSKAETLVFHTDSANIRRAAAAFVQHSTLLQNEDMQQNWKGLASFCASRVGSGGYLECKLAVDAFWGLEIFNNVQPALAMLGGDMLNDDTTVRCLMACVLFTVQRWQQEESHANSKSSESRTQLVSCVEAIAPRLGDLLVSRRADIHVQTMALQLIPIVLTTETQLGHVDKVIKELKLVCLERGNMEVLVPAAAALACLMNDTTTKRKISPVVNEICQVIAKHIKEAITSSADLDLSQWLMRASTIALGVADVADVLVGEDVEYLVELIRERLSLPESEHQGSIVLHAARLIMAVGAWDVMKTTDDKQNTTTTTTETIVKARTSRHACSRVMGMIYENTSVPAYIRRDAIGLLHDIRTLFWPGFVGFGWVPSPSLLQVADDTVKEWIQHVVTTAAAAASVEEENDADKSRKLASLHVKEASLRQICETALVPAARAALFACARKDVTSGARLLRLANSGSSEPMIARVIHHFEATMRDADKDRCMQMHLEAILLESTTADDGGGGGATEELANVLVGLLPKPKTKTGTDALQALQGPLCRMIKRGVTMAFAQLQEDGGGNGAKKFDAMVVAMSRYLNHADVSCKAKIMATWNPLMETAKDKDESFMLTRGEVVGMFQAKMEGKSTPMKKGVKRSPMSHRGGMTSNKKSIGTAPSGGGRGKAATKRSKVMMSSDATTSVKKKKRTKAVSSEDEEPNMQQRSLPRPLVFKETSYSASSSSAKKALKKKAKVVDASDDDDESVTKDVANVVATKLKMETVEEGEEEEEDEDDDDDLVGFRPKHVW